MLGGERDQARLDRARRRLGRHAVEVEPEEARSPRCSAPAGGGGGDPHLADVDLELLGHDLGDLGVEALAHLGAAVVQMDAAVGIDVDQAPAWLYWVAVNEIRT